MLQAAEAGQGADARGLPLWARWDARNFRNTVVTTSDQYVILVEVASGQQSRAPPAVMEGIGDTGATRSLMDLETARRVGLQVEVAHGSEFGTYFGPGSKERPYAGRVVGPVVLRFGKEVQLELRELKLIHHSEPLLLIGADVLCGGRAGWTYRAMGCGKRDDYLCQREAHHVTAPRQRPDVGASPFRISRARHVRRNGSQRARPPVSDCIHRVGARRATDGAALDHCS